MHSYLLLLNDSVISILIVSFFLPTAISEELNVPFQVTFGVPVFLNWLPGAVALMNCLSLIMKIKGAYHFIYAP
jgi:hypothetical protein